MACQSYSSSALREAVCDTSCSAEWGCSATPVLAASASAKPLIYYSLM